MKVVSDPTIISILDDACRLSETHFREILVTLELYSFKQLDEPEGKDWKRGKRNLVTAVLTELNSGPKYKLKLLLDELNRRKLISPTTRRALAMDGIEFDGSVAGDLADPVDERSLLEKRLSDAGMTQVSSYLDQSLQNYAQANYEAANAMSRTALEDLIARICGKISILKNNEVIPTRGSKTQPVEYREYLQTKGFLDQSERAFLDKFYGYASGNGSHPGVSSESEARLRRFVVIALALLFLEKLEDTHFMSQLK